MGERRTKAGEPELDFEEALRRLERVVAELEAGELSLERSLERFEEGVRLVKLCSSRLQAAEVYVRQLEEGDSHPVEPEEPEEEL